MFGAGLITQVQLFKALTEQQERGGRIVGILTALGFLDPDHYARFLAKEAGTPSVHLSNYEVPEDVLALVPCDFVLQNEVFPIDRLKNLLTVGMVCPLDSVSLREVERITGLRARPVLCGAEELRLAVNRCYAVPSEDESLEDYFSSFEPRTRSFRGGRRDQVEQEKHVALDGPVRSGPGSDVQALHGRERRQIERADGSMVQVLSEMHGRRRLHEELVSEIEGALSAWQGHMDEGGDSPRIRSLNQRVAIQQEVTELLRERRQEKQAYWHDVAALRRELRQMSRH